jgi:hypothetical protein
MGSASIAGSDSMTDVDLQHNLIQTDTHRMPLFKAKNGRFVNNLTYNWSYYAALSGGGVSMDYINNIWKPALSMLLSVRPAAGKSQPIWHRHAVLAAPAEARLFIFQVT